MIVQQPYEFRALKWVDTKDTVNAINRYIVTDYSYMQGSEFLKIRPFEGDTTLQPVMVYGLSDVEKDISAFSHPLMNVKNNWIAMDLRQMVHVDKETGQVKVRSEGDYQLSVQRFILSGMWATGKQSAVYAFKFPHIVYGEFLATSLARKFGLHMGDQIRLKVLGCLYYASLFVDKLSDEDLDKLRIRLKNEVLVEDILDDIFKERDLMTSLDGFGQACYNVTGNIRLKSLDYNVLVSILSTSWFGLNAKETLLLGMDHPPTWCALVYSCLTQRSFKNSGLAKIVEQKDKKDAGKEYLDALVYHTKTYKAD